MLIKREDVEGRMPSKGNGERMKVNNQTLTEEEKEENQGHVTKRYGRERKDGNYNATSGAILNPFSCKPSCNRPAGAFLEYL